MALPLLIPALAVAFPFIVKKVLIALSIGTLTYVGLQAAFDSMQANVISNYGSISGTALQLANLAGVNASIGILLGALAARISMFVVTKYSSIL